MGFARDATTYVLGCALLLGCGCNGGESGAVERAQGAQPTTYERARWRLAPEQLDRVLLRVAHIAIRHRATNGEESTLRSPGWLPDKEVTRTREQAIDLALEVADAARRAPERFAALAREHSDDTVTAPWGGSLGVMPASHLPTQFLDAIATLQPGQVSKPFETEYGIHVIKLEQTPPEQQLAATRVLIAYRDSALAIVRPGHTREREHAEAIALAHRVYEEARAPGADFHALVERYSDSPDVEQGGDLGVWSTYAPMIRPLVLEALSRVAIGEVTAPVDTPEGVQILLRTPAEPRERFAAEYLAVSPLNDRPREEMRDDMHKIVAEIQAKPEAFDAYRRTLCCRAPLVWSRGRGLGAEVENVLRQLGVGELARAPVETATGLYLVKRLFVPPEDHLAALTRLPSPAAPDIDSLIRNANGPMLAYNLRLIGQQISVLPVAQSKRDQLSTLVADVSASLSGASAQERPGHLARFWSRSAEILTPNELTQLRTSLTEFATGYLMNM